MSQATKLGLVTDSVKRASHRASQNAAKYAIRKRDNFLSKPIIRTVNSRFQYLISQENLDNVRLKCDEYYHWVAGTEVTEVQERARELESKLNVKRKNMIEAREQMDNVTERLRGIAVELENTRRGDPKHLHLRQLEYETIQEEMKLSKFVQRTEFEERETFTWLMNAVRESHETERNYNQRIKMLSLIGAALGPFIGYMFSARLNAMRFRRMEEIINKKLELLSFTTLNAIREIHGLEPEIMSDSEKQGLITRIVTAFYALQTLLEESYKIAITTSADLVESIKEEGGEVVTEVKEEDHKTQESHKSQETQTDDIPMIVRVLDDAETREITVPQTAGVHSNPLMIEKIIVEKSIPQKINFAELPEYKSLMSALKLIEDKQENLKQVLLTSQELQEASKIEVSVNSSDDEIISMLQADQQTVRKILLSLSDLLQDSRTSIGSTLQSIISNIDTLSMKISNNSELYVGNLEHSKIINDIAKSLTEVKSNIDTIETYYINDVNKQFTELASIHGDLSSQIEGVKAEIDSQVDNLGYMKESIASGFGEQEKSNRRIESILDEINSILHEMRGDRSIDSTINKVDDVIGALGGIKSLLEFTISENNARYAMSEDGASAEHLEKTLAQFEEKILRQYQAHQDSISEKIDNIVIPAPTIIYTKDAVTETAAPESKISSDFSDTPSETFEISEISTEIADVSPDTPEVALEDLTEHSETSSSTCLTSGQSLTTSGAKSLDKTPEVHETSPEVSEITQDFSNTTSEFSNTTCTPEFSDTTPEFSETTSELSSANVEVSGTNLSVSEESFDVLDPDPAVSDVTFISGFPDEIIEHNEDVPTIEPSLAEDVETISSSSQDSASENLSQASGESDAISKIPSPSDNMSITPPVGTERVPPVIMTDSISNQDTLSGEIGYPGTSEESPKKSTVYLYSVFVTVYTVVAYFFR